ncbi:hypothetical protein K493DRAFT_358464 [Basidiobolus meristosporus CBS 931.73]|uniref:DDT domain-containing protein n=1 Tax=Basidiobolus meristosporus CBS 931.73 TaxID=1314790 RepID=A0A1Y1XTZ9_9FUNG|nr:hypothetical protein K493DRAFT_358464 [Basidiobolus meristosporus CBS 931.73]|eukprot:ORX89220.1 hypothetical protein K493DRAFT_358464 [Basidiobolus meristosporus CBS 931.73]
MMVTCKKRKDLAESRVPNKQSFEIAVPDIDDVKRRKFSIDPHKGSKMPDSGTHEKPEASDNEPIKAKRTNVELKIAKPLRKPILEFIQFKTCSLETLIEHTYEEFLNQYFPEEILTIQTADAMCVISRKGKVIERVAPTEVKGNTEEDETPLEPKANYLVALLRGTEEDTKILVKADDMSRSRLSYSKIAIRQLISNTASRRRDLKDFPWVVQPKYCRRYHVSLRIPNELKPTKNPAPQSKSDKKPAVRPVIEPPAVKYPIEDLELPTSSILTSPPELTSDFPVANDLMGDVLMIWSFLDTFGFTLITTLSRKPICISPFSLEDFMDALHHQTGDAPCSLITECYVALLNVVIASKMDNINENDSEENAESSDTTNEMVDWQLNVLDIKYKVAILNCLLEHVLDAEAIRQYIQECLEAYSETRKELYETKREFNQVRASIMEYEKADKLSELLGDTEEGKIDDSESSKSRSRLREEARVKEQEAKARVEERRRLGELEMRLDRKLNKLSLEMDKYLVLRHEALGYDRFFNGYHLFGRLDYAKTRVGHHAFLSSLEPNRWYCIAEDKIEEVVNWLNPKGCRELELKQSLEKNLEKVMGSAKKRVNDQRSIQGKRHTYNTRPVEKPYLRYVNTWVR